MLGCLVVVLVEFVPWGERVGMWLTTKVGLFEVCEAFEEVRPEGLRAYILY